MYNAMKKRILGFIFVTCLVFPVFCEETPYKTFAEIGQYAITAVNDVHCLFRNHVYKNRAYKRLKDPLLQNKAFFKKRLTVYYPQKDGASPLVVISHGFGNSKKTQASLAKYLASRGYVCVIFTARYTFCVQDFFEALEAAFSLIFAAVKDPKSVLFQKIDCEKTAVIGYSMGAAAALQYAADHPLLKAVVALNPWGLSSKILKSIDGKKRRVPIDLTALKVPAMVLTGSDDGIAYPSKAFSFCKKMNETVSLAFFSIKDGKHFHPIDTLSGMFNPEKNAFCRALVFSWLELFLHSNAEPANMLYLDPQHLAVLSSQFKSFDATAYPPFLLKNVASTEVFALKSSMESEIHVHREKKTDAFE